MTWTDLTTYVNDDIPDEENLNNEWSGNLNYLLTPNCVVHNTDLVKLNTASTTFVDTGAEVTITKVEDNSDLVFNFMGGVNGALSAVTVYFDIYNQTSGASLNGNDGCYMQGIQAQTGSPPNVDYNYTAITFRFIYGGLAAGTYTFRPRMKLLSGAATISLERGQIATGNDISVGLHFSCYERHQAA